MLTQLPTVISVAIAIITALVVIWLKVREVNITDKTTVGTVQYQQVESLMAQITMLSNELERTRSQLSDLHDQNVELMKELRKANYRITELEKLIEISPQP